MSWTQQVFNYCERGQDPTFWAEPLNALSNGAFVVAAVTASLSLARLPAPPPGMDRRAGERLALWGLVALVGAIGIGSFLFHTFATRWAAMADVGPITVFMLAYLTFALRSFLGLGWLPIGTILPAFLLAGGWTSSLTCASSKLVAITEAAREPCFNGSLGYAPALMSLVIIGGLAARRQVAGRMLLAAAAVFLLSMALRTLDRDVCAATRFLGQVRGTHALWHLLNATTLYLLLAAGIGHVRRREGRTAPAAG